MATVGVVFRPKPPSLVIRGEKGRGSYGTVCHGKLEGKPVMIKRIHEILLTSSRSNQLRKFEQECQILETLHHPNIVRSLGAFWDGATREPLLVMEPMRENLREHLERRKQADAKLSVDDHLSIALSIAEGLKFLHEQKQPIAHRDLNDKNILVGEDGSVKIGDFGQSTLLAGSTEYMGTMAPGAIVFMPPEALMDEPHYNLKVDSFSMGVLMLEVSTQMSPPARMGNIGSSQEVERRSKDLALLDSCHPLKPLIIWCLQNQYKLRPDVATIHSQLMTLKHPELQQKVEELQTGLREAELHSLQLEGTLQKSNEQMEVLKDDNKNLETELEATKEKVLKQTLDLEEQNRTLEQWKNENEQLEGQLKSSRDRESQLMLQLRQTERALAEKQALQEELTRRLRQKDEEIAVLSSENEAMASYASDSLKKLQDIKTAVETVTSAVDKIEENCTKSGKRDNNGGSNLKCADALYCVSMPKAGSESSAKVLLQNELRGCNPVVDARKLTRCGNRQFLVLLEAMKSSSKESNESHDVTTLVEKQKTETDIKLLMTEVCSVRFTSHNDCDVIETVRAILEMDPNLTDCNVTMRPDSDKNEVTITGSWHSIHHLRNQLMDVFHSATKKQQPLTGDAVRPIVNYVVSGECTKEEEEAKDAAEGANTAGVMQSTMDVPVSKCDENTTPENGSSTVSQVQTSPPHPFNVGSHQTGHGVGASTTGAADAPSILSITIPFHQSRNLTIKKGNLVEEAVVAIVNSTDEHLQHSSGVAKAINEASGGAVQTALNDVVARMGGGAKSGRVVMTAAGGSLRCQHVIHSIWPAARERSNERYERLLKELCQEVICVADERQLKSIALPPMTPISYELSKEVVAQIIIDSILRFPFPVNSLMTDIRIVISDDETWSLFLKYAVEIKKSLPAARAWSTASKRNVRSQSHSMNDGPCERQPEGPHKWQSSPAPGATVSHSTTYLPTTPVPAEDMVEIPLEKTHRKMVIKKAHFLYEDADIKVAAICSELGFGTGYSKELDGHLKGKLSEAVRVRYQYRKPDRFDVFTVRVQHASINCHYLVIVNILDRSLGTRHDAHKCLQQILQAVCQEADTLEMPSVAIAPKTFAVGGFQPEHVLPEFIHMLNQFKFTNQDFLTDVRFLALDSDTFDILIAGVERAIGRSPKQPPKHTQTPSTVLLQMLRGQWAEY